MRLTMFDLIDETLNELRLNYPTYQYVENKLKIFLENELNTYDEMFVSTQSRIKQENSLKEKMIRNKFYMNCHTPDEALNNLSDLIGINVECRFISDEDKIYKIIKKLFILDDLEFSKCIKDPNIFLNVKIPQPQLQRNGFTIYRIDGYYNFNGKHINFELQIKSLIHNFWNEIEHQVVYKNNHLVFFDTFMQNILASIKDNLDTVDNQLQIVYNQIKDESISSSNNIGLSEDSFKMFIARSINDLFSLKMKESVGVTTNFKKCSGILSQYIYIKDFINCEYTQVRMVEYFEQFNLLKLEQLDFTVPIKLETKYSHYDIFSNLLGRYLEDIINVDFEWHVFFVMLFAIEPGDNIQDFSDFIKVIRNIIVVPSWYNQKFTTFGADKAKIVRDALLEGLAKELIDVKKINIIYEENLYQVSNIFRNSIDELDEAFNSFEEISEQLIEVVETLRRKIRQIFK